MLILARKLNEQIRIFDDIVITVIEVAGGKVRLGVEAPRRSVPGHPRGGGSTSRPAPCFRSNLALPAGH
jgi:hypothetical protein